MVPENTQQTAAPVASPCVRNCMLDEKDVCKGCGRTLEEITTWASIDNQARQAILDRLQAASD